jgi:DNA-directed RNA polymerase subunit RPC12/RpoP
MYGDHAIVCQHCKKSIGMTQEDYMYRSLKDVEPKDLKCPHCGKVVIEANKE